MRTLLSQLPETMRAELESKIGALERAKTHEACQQTLQAARAALQTALSTAEDDYEKKIESFHQISQTMEQWIQKAIEQNQKALDDLVTESNKQLASFAQAATDLRTNTENIKPPDIIQRPWYQELLSQLSLLHNVTSDLAKDKSGLMKYVMDNFRKAYHLANRPEMYEAAAFLIMRQIVRSHPPAAKN